MRWLFSVLGGVSWKVPAEGLLTLSWGLEGKSATLRSLAAGREASESSCSSSCVGTRCLSLQTCCSILILAGENSADVATVGDRELALS